MKPTVAAIMLTNGSRPEMFKRAVRSFHSQSYTNKVLIVLHSGPDPFISPTEGIQITWSPGRPRSIGELRNLANGLVTDADIILHMDDDDWSHPERIGEQVAFLQETGAHAVGYSEMLFWKHNYKILGYMAADPTPVIDARGVMIGVSATIKHQVGEAWLYTSPNPNTCLGTSLCYWRKTWESVPFRNIGEGEDHQWSLDLSSHRCMMRACSAGVAIPRMIANIHGGNSFGAIKPGAQEWQRFSGMDQYCMEAMKL